MKQPDTFEQFVIAHLNTKDGNGTNTYEQMAVKLLRHQHAKLVRLVQRLPVTHSLTVTMTPPSKPRNLIDRDDLLAKLKEILR